MPISTITFVRPGLEPMRTRNTASKQAFDRVISEVKSRNWSGEEPLVVPYTSDSKPGEANGLARKLKQHLDEKKFEVYTAKDAQGRLCVVVRKVRAEEPAKPAGKKR